MDQRALHRWWPEVVGGATDLRDDLLARWDADGRGYHDLLHLAEVLERIDELVAHEPAGVDRDAVVLAAWFHDAVYDGAADDEERSAVLAEEALAATPVLAVEVARLVRLTAHHRPEADDRNGAVLVDADLGILADTPERYAAYVAGVRAEHAQVPDDAFTRGRSAILQALLAKPTLFHTAHARAAWEPRARANVERELAAS